MHIPLLLTVTLSATSCAYHSGVAPEAAAGEDPFDVLLRHGWQVSEYQLSQTAVALAPTNYPFTTRAAGTWETTGPKKWTSGFFPGSLWFMYQQTTNPLGKTQVQDSIPTEWGKPAREVYPPSADIRVIRDLVYARYGERFLKLDLYLPPSQTDRPIPGIVVIRGGGWRFGDKEGFAFIAAYLAKAGLAAASIEYRPSTEATFPAAVYDAKAAVRWMRANAKRYGINAGAIGVIGGSAGAHLAALLGTSSHASELEGNGGYKGVSSRVQAVVAMAPPTDFVSASEGGRFPASTDSVIEAFLGKPLNEALDLWKVASPITYVQHDSAPILLLHSQADNVVPYQQSVFLRNRYKKVGAQAELHSISDAPHGFWNYTRWFSDSMDRTVAFFTRMLARRQQPRKASPTNPPGREGRRGRCIASP